MLFSDWEMRKQITLSLIGLWVLLGVSCSKEDMTMPTLFNTEELVLNSSKNEIDLTLNDVGKYYYFSKVCDDVNPDSTVVHEFESNRDTIHGAWFTISTNDKSLSAVTLENNSNKDRKLRILFYIAQDRQVLTITQKGK